MRNPRVLEDELNRSDQPPDLILGTGGAVYTPIIITGRVEQ